MIARTLLVLGLAAFAATGSQTSSAARDVTTVGCDQIIGTATSGDAAGYRVVLGVVSAPPARMPGVARDPAAAPFSFWRKAAMVIRGSTRPVTVTVAPAFARRARIGWGNPAHPSRAVRFAACPARSVWNAYAGGFFLRTTSACVPLTFTVGARSATLRFGVGETCR